MHAACVIQGLGLAWQSCSHRLHAYQHNWHVLTTYMRFLVRKTRTRSKRFSGTCKPRTPNDTKLAAPG
jgi:hypothetical protein